MLKANNTSQANSFYHAVSKRAGYCHAITGGCALMQLGTTPDLLMLSAPKPQAITHREPVSATIRCRGDGGSIILQKD